MHNVANKKSSQKNSEKHIKKTGEQAWSNVIFFSYFHVRIMKKQDKQTKIINIFHDENCIKGFALSKKEKLRRIHSK